LDQPIEPVEVVGNLPYYITSDILLRLFEYRRYVRTCVLMVQSEVADRLVAQPGNSEYGILSATTQLYAEVETILSLAAELVLAAAESEFQSRTVADEFTGRKSGTRETRKRIHCFSAKVLCAEAQDAVE
jgi:hypothetical protein